MTTTFKAGDKVRYDSKGKHRDFDGLEMTVTETTHSGTKGKSLNGYFAGYPAGHEFHLSTEYIKLVEEAKLLTLNGFTVGDKVRYNGYLWQNLEGVVSSINGGLLDIRVTKLHDNAGSYSNVQVGKTLVEACGGKGIDTGSLEKIEEPAAPKVGDRVTVKGWEKHPEPTWEGRTGIIDYVGTRTATVQFEDSKQPESGGWEFKYLVPAEAKPFTFKDIQVGDTIRRTATYKGATEVREGVVGTKGSYYFANEQGNYILAYDTDGTTSITDVTLELLNRPEPESVKEAWETAKAGDRLVVRNHKGITRVLTKLENDEWDTLLIRLDGSTWRGMTRSTAEVKGQLSNSGFSDSEPQFVKA